MYRILSIVLLFLITGLTLAQDDPVIMPDDLPEPVFSDNFSIFYAGIQEIAWLDNETLVFTTPEQASEIGYHYSLTDDRLTQLESNPFRLTMTDEELVYYQASATDPVYHSPYADEFDTHHLMYTSIIQVDCGGVCTIVMQGRYHAPMNNELDNVSNNYVPADFLSFAGFDVVWGQDDNSAVIEVGSPYGGSTTFNYINFDGGLIEGIVDFRIIDNVDDRILGISADGKHVAFASYWNPSGTENVVYNSQRLIIWTAPYYDELCSCTYDAQIHVIESALRQENIGSYFAGVGFVNENTILYIGELGLMRHNLLTGISVPIDRELNVGWIRTAVFSPDFQHVAITTEQGLFILPLSL